MKKIILIGILMSCMISIVNAQQYYPMLDTINKWVYGSSICAVSPHQKSTTSASCGYPNIPSWDYAEIYTTQDTLIDTLIYKTVIAGDYSTSNYCLYGFIREDTAMKKIYFKDTTNNPEMLLYDFSMQIGDTINLHFFNSGNYFENGRYRLDSITSINLPVGARRVFYLKCDTCAFYYGQHLMVWIEGLGFPGDVIYPYSINMTGMCPCHEILNYYNDNYFSQLINCFEHANKVYYDTLNAALMDTCYYHKVCGGGVPEIKSLSSFEFAPNPANDAITIEMKISMADDFELDIRDLKGKQILKKISFGKLGKGTYQKTVDVSSLPSGMYIIECNAKSGSLYRKLVIQK